MRRLTRREFLTISASGLVVFASGGLVSCAPTTIPTPTPVAGPQTDGGKFTLDPKQALPLPLWITRNEDFYTVKYADLPSIGLDSWRLFVYGLVRDEMRLTLDEVKALPAITTMHTLECIGNPVGGNLIGNANWRGILLRDVLTRAGVDTRAQFVTIGGVDDYFTTVPLATALEEHALLAYAMNDQPLPLSHGFPLRALLPGVYGQKQPKWITSIEVTNEDKLGPWEQKGWSRRATIKLNSGIQEPRQGTTPARGDLLIAGYAQTNAIGIRAVDVSTDAGATWHATTITPAPSPYVWTPWGWRWRDVAAGRYTLMARATDRAGATQDDARAGILSDVFPDGTSAIHSFTLEVRER
ncbi:MAG: molybdopterin-dependent oxidoreductase [Chloroflexi bacterium]|nr:molybdopterin-dependent oxidoreductase [Chloroflexota bacterium]